MSKADYELIDNSKVEFKLPEQTDFYNITDFNDNTTNTITALTDLKSGIKSHVSSADAHRDIQTSIISRAKSYTDSQAADLENKIAGSLEGAKAYADNVVGTHNTSADAHENRFSIIETDLRDKVPFGELSAHNTSADAHGALFGTLSTRVDGLDGGLGAAVTKLNAMQTHPCYEYATSGGNVQRFDDVSEIAHRIGITVHGATDSDGNMVTNPKVSVYGKNLFKFGDRAGGGFTFSGSSCKIVNPTQLYNWNNDAVFMLPPGTYTYSATVTGSRSATSKFNTYYQIGDENAVKRYFMFDSFTSGTMSEKYTFNISVPTQFRFGNIWFAELQTADLTIDFQLEIGGTATEYEPYVEPQTTRPQTSFAEGEVFKIETFTAVSPSMTIIASDDNNLISTVDVVYNADLMKRIAKIESAIAAQA